MAWVGGVIEVYVDKIIGDSAVVIMGDEEEATVLLTDLKPV
jgi:hypothetical protein